MLVKMVGVQLLDFDAEGKKIEGIKLHMTHEDMNVFGLCASTKFVQVKSPLYSKFQPYLNDLDSILNHQVKFETDMKGRIQSFEVLPLEKSISTEKDKK